MTLQHKTPGQVLATYTYTVPTGGNITQVVEAVRQSSGAITSTTISYGYAPLSRLVNATYSSGEVVSYTYDAAGNRLSEVDCWGGASCTPITTTYGYDAANRLTSAGGITYTLGSRRRHCTSTSYC